MLYITYLVLIYLKAGSLYLLTTSIQFPVPWPLPLVTTNVISFSISLFICLFVKYNWPTTECYFLIHNIFDISVHFKMIMIINLVMICHHTKILTIIEYVNHAEHFTPLTHLFCNWKFVHLNLPHPFLFSPTPFPSGNHQFVLCIYDSVSCISLSDKFHLE